MARVRRKNSTLNRQLQGVLRDAVKRRDELNAELRRTVQLIAGLETVLRSMTDGSSPPPTPPPASPNGTSTREKGIPALASKILAEVGRPLSTNELTELLIHRGKEFRTSQPQASVKVLLRRHKERFRYAEGKWSLR